MMLPNLRIYGMIAGGLFVLGLIVALFVTRATLAEVKGERDVLTAKLSVSNASVESCAAEMDKVTAMQKALAESDANRIAASRQAIELARAAQEARQAAIDRLRASAEALASAEPVAACEASPALLSDWPA